MLFAIRLRMAKQDTSQSILFLRDSGFFYLTTKFLKNRDDNRKDKTEMDTTQGRSTMSRFGNAAVFLDRDGTIIEDRGHLRDPSEVIFFPETFEALQKLQDYFLLFIVTNQVGVAKGIMTAGDVNKVNRYVVAALAEKDVVVTDVYTCMHTRADNCPCIKPKPFFLKKAAACYDIDLSVSFTIGDHPHDIQLAQNAGAHGIYVLSGHGNKHQAEISEGTQVVPGIIQATEKIMSALPG